MYNFNLPKYNLAIQWINNARVVGDSWDTINYARQAGEQQLNSFLQTFFIGNSSLTADEWHGLVTHLKNVEEQEKQAESVYGTSSMVDGDDNNEMEIPTGEYSAWVNYRQKLLDKRYLPESVEEIERSVHKSLRCLSNNTTNIDPIKGLVVGNVQSGKTGHMAGLIAMAADNGFNMFIVFSGLLESLRIQNFGRLVKDLNNSNSTTVWTPVDHPCANMPTGQNLSDLTLGENSNVKYLTVCLKNPTRLRNLIDWLQSDARQQEKLRILVIDDEADQGSINTEDLDLTKISQISNSLSCLVTLNNGVVRESIVAKFIELASCDNDNDRYQYSKYIFDHCQLKANIQSDYVASLLCELINENSLDKKSALAKMIAEAVSCPNTKTLEKELYSYANCEDTAESRRKAINRLLCDLVAGRTKDDNPCANKYKAMNYVAYTATPYANILNEEPNLMSLYPSKFIMALRTSKEYFGPQQIFGVNNGDYDGLNIVRDIEDAEMETISLIHNDVTEELPETLKDSLCWFLCGVVCMRKWGHRDPISMLIHTSHLTNDHTQIEGAVRDWLNNETDASLMRRCEAVWNAESAKFTKTIFRTQYYDYAVDDKNINDLPSFDSIRTELHALISVQQRLNYLRFDDTSGKPICCDTGINFCIDNSEREERIKYPKKDDLPSIAPAYLVIGGATLSRGLTFEGLICSYFSRTTRQADSLMQMGRWFGYRRGYELLPRIWMNKETHSFFDYLSDMDQELRDEIREMAILGKLPKEFGPRVKYSPRRFSITSAYKMQGAKAVSLDFTGTFIQTILFDADNDILKANLDCTISLLNDLEVGGRANIDSPCRSAIVWESIPYQRILSYLDSYQFQSRMRAMNNKDLLLQWIDRMTQTGVLGNWNVVLAGKNDNGTDGNSTLKISDTLTISKVNRAPLDGNPIPNVYNIKALRNPKDILADIDLAKLSDDQKKTILSAPSKDTNTHRTRIGLGGIPQLIIYIIDKNSQSSSTSRTTYPNTLSVDIAGICINIPGEINAGGRITHVQIDIK